MQLTYSACVAATKQHKTVFFDSSLKPVTPRDGQWFCEFDVGNDDELRDEALVEYVGSGRVMPDGDDEDRYPRGVILILQRWRAGGYYICVQSEYGPECAESYRQ